VLKFQFLPHRKQIWLYYKTQ